VIVSLARPVRTLHARARGLSAPLREALALETAPRAEIDAVVGAKLAALATFACEHVPFWRERFAAAGVDPSGVRTAADLAPLPLLTKDDLRVRGAALLAGSRVDPAWIRNASGGSTGKPVTFYQDREYQRRMLADQERHVTWTGLPWWTPRAWLWGATRDSTTHTSVKGRIRDGLEGSLFLNTFRATDDDYRAFAERCARANVPLVVGYASSLEHFARLLAHARERAPTNAGGGFAGWRPRAVQSAAERLTDDMRRLIATELGAPVFDRYGAREMGNAAHECRAHTGLHVSMERVIVEVVRFGKMVPDGEEGELVVTVLDNRVEPLIRYETGDLGRKIVAPPCPCGRTYERIEITAGRTSDLFTAPSGRRIHGMYFTHLFYGREGIAAFHVTQESRERIVLDIVRGSGDVEGDVHSVREAILELDPGFSVETRYVEAIPATESGKRRFTVSKVPLEW
jgi:phenylacetate-CoA ligase